MSPTIKDIGLALATMRVWYVICSIVTDKVFLFPCMTIPTESPTSNNSTPARSAKVANVASYAVTIEIGCPDVLDCASCGTVNFARDGVDMGDPFKIRT